MSDKKTTVVSFLLDETGSMSTIKDDTIGGFNNYVEGLRKSGEEFEFSFVKFDSNHTTKVHVGVPITDVLPLTPETYQPGAMTPLIDAAVKIIRATEESVKERDVNVVVVIQTDGHENSSTAHTTQDLAELVKEKTAEGWEFVFLGAGIDAFSIAQQYGISAANSLSYDRQTSAQTFDSLTSNTVAYASTGVRTSLNFDDGQRQASGDKFHQADPVPAKNDSRVSEKKRRPSSLVDDISLTA